MIKNAFAKYITSTSRPAFLMGLSLNIASTAIMAWGPIVNKFALVSIRPLSAALLSTMFGSLFCFLFSQLNRKPIALPKGRSIFYISALNGLGVLFLFTAQGYLSPTMVGFMGRFYVVFTTLLSVAILHEKMTMVELAAIFVAILSSFLLNYQTVDAASIIGIVLILAQTFLFALVNMLVKIKMKDQDSNSVLFFNNLISSFCLLGFVIAKGHLGDLFSMSLSGIAWVLVSSFLASFLGILLFYQGLRYIGFAEANLIRATSPILTAIYAYFFFPVQMSLLNKLGACFLVISIITLAFSKMNLISSPRDSILFVERLFTRNGGNILGHRQDAKARECQARRSPDHAEN